MKKKPKTKNPEPQPVPEPEPEPEIKWPEPIERPSPRGEGYAVVDLIPGKIRLVYGGILLGPECDISVVLAIPGVRRKCQVTDSWLASFFRASFCVCASRDVSDAARAHYGVKPPKDDAQDTESAR